MRVRAGLDSYVDNTGLVHWDPVAQEVDETTSMLVARTRATGISVTLAAAVAVEGGTSEAKACDAERSPASDQYLVVVPGQPVTATKFVAVVPDVTDADPQQRARTVAAAIRATGWDAWRHASDAASVSYTHLRPGTMSSPTVLAAPIPLAAPTLLAAPIPLAAPSPGGGPTGLIRILDAAADVAKLCSPRARRLKARSGTGPDSPHPRGTHRRRRDRPDRERGPAASACAGPRSVSALLRLSLIHI